MKGFPAFLALELLSTVFQLNDGRVHCLPLVWMVTILGMFKAPWLSLSKTVGGSLMHGAIQLSHHLDLLSRVLGHCRQWVSGLLEL